MPTTIKLKNSVTTTNAPSSLAQGEVAINITDKKVWVGNAAGTPIQLLGAGGSASFGALTCTSLTNSGLTSGRVTYATTAGLLTDSANLTFNGTTLTAAALTSTGVATFSAGTVSAPAITTTGDTNTGIFFPAADTIAFTEGGVESMRIDSSGNVGMGRAPLYQLDVYRSGTQSPAIASANDNIVTILQSVGSSQGNVGTITSHPLCLFSGNLERVRIDTSGNVGIGTSSPSYRLDVSTTTATLFRFTNSTNSTGLIGYASGSGNSYIGDLTLASTSKSAINFNSTNATLGFFTNDTERMRIDSSGRVGIGTTPSAWGSGNSVLDIGASGALLGSNTGAGVVDLYYNNFFNGSNSIYKATGFASYYRQNTGDHIWYNAPSGTAGATITFTERMRITSAGYLKVSNDGTYTNVSDSFHEVNQSANNHAWYIRANNASQTLDACQISTARNTTNNSYYALAYYNGGAGAYKFRVADSGNCTNTNGSYGTISDIKNKENIVDATPKLDKVKQLKVRNYNFKGDDLKQIGFVAQEFEQVFPSMVEEHSDRDAEGNDLGTTTKSIKTSVLVPILVKAIQEQQAMIEELKQEVAKLKGV